MAAKTLEEAFREYMNATKYDTCSWAFIAGWNAAMNAKESDSKKPATNNAHQLCDCEQLFIGCAITGGNCKTHGLNRCSK